MCILKLIAYVNYLRLDLIHLCQTVYVDYDCCEANASGFDRLPVCMNG
jgi:hypothetical protein